MIDFDLSGQTAIVTGTSGNLGPIWAETLRDLGVRVYGFGLPVYDIRSMQQAEKFVNEMYYGPDILINNAGIDNPPDTDAKIFKNWDEILDVNLTGVKNMIKAVLPGMIDRSQGHIINIGSMYGLVSPDQSLYPDDFEKPVAYGVSKAGLLHLTKLIATQFGNNGIRCNCLTLGPVYSPAHSPEFREKMIARIPLGRMANKQDLKQALR
ncbi:hypothetical protein LCGC14_2207900, partial [marine sediment metagenome]